jgi:hypothetical protein
MVSFELPHAKQPWAKLKILRTADFVTDIGHYTLFDHLWSEPKT